MFHRWNLRHLHLQERLTNCNFCSSLLQGISIPLWSSTGTHAEQGLTWNFPRDWTGKGTQRCTCCFAAGICDTWLAPVTECCLVIGCTVCVLPCICWVYCILHHHHVCRVFRSQSERKKKSVDVYVCLCSWVSLYKRVFMCVWVCVGFKLQATLAWRHILLFPVEASE